MMMRVSTRTILSLIYRQTIRLRMMKRMRLTMIAQYRAVNIQYMLLRKLEREGCLSQILTRFIRPSQSHSLSASQPRTQIITFLTRLLWLNYAVRTNLNK